MLPDKTDLGCCPGDASADWVIATNVPIIASGAMIAPMVRRRGFIFGS
jgi:hypothetical protein